MPDFDLGIRCDYFLPMSPLGLKRDYFLGIKGSKIISVAPWANQKVKKFIHAQNKIVMPGLINGHTHLPMTLFKGLGDDLPFDEWLNNYILPTERKLVNVEFVRVGAELAALELLRSGVTTVCDMYYFEEVICDVLDKAGMRGLLAPSVSDFPNADTINKRDQFKILDQMLEKYKNHDRITPCIAAHSIYGCGEETLLKVRDYSQKHGIPLIVHASETKKELEESLEQFKKTPIARLESLGLMDSQCILAHCVHATDSDIDILYGKKTSVIYNPESNMKLGVGAAPIPKMIKKGLKIGIGTDGSASNNDLSIFGEMDFGAKLQKHHNRNTSIIEAHELLVLATLGGAKALGLSDKVGTLEEGKRADIILVDLNYPHMRPLNNVYSQLVYSAKGQEIDTVICDGKILIENRKNLVLDEARIYSEADKLGGLIRAEL